LIAATIGAPSASAISSRALRVMSATSGTPQSTLTRSSGPSG